MFSTPSSHMSSLNGEFSILLQMLIESHDGYSVVTNA